MGWGWLKKGLGAIGDVAKFAAPALNFIPGVGTLAAAGIGAAGGMLGQLNNENPSWKSGLKEGAISGIGTYGFGKGMDAYNAANPGGSLLGQIGGGVRGVGGLLGGGGQGGQGGINWPGMLMGGVDTFMNAKDATRNRGLEDEQINWARDSQARQRALEDQILGSLNKPLNVPDLNNVFADPSNPFYNPMSAPQAPPQVATDMGGGGMVPSGPSFPPSGPTLPPPQDPANDVLRRLSPVPRRGGGGGGVVPLDYRL